MKVICGFELMLLIVEIMRPGIKKKDQQLNIVKFVSNKLEQTKKINFFQFHSFSLIAEKKTVSVYKAESTFSPAFTNSMQKNGILISLIVRKKRKRKKGNKPDLPKIF